VRTVLTAPAHPYTLALLKAIPRRGVARGALQGLAGTVPDLIDPPPGCRFAPRCARATAACTAALPPLATLAGAHEVACLHPVREAADA
jgi:oligopeptide/dipeptide ABC transporter ATP-binding protein